VIVDTNVERPSVGMNAGGGLLDPDQGAIDPSPVTITGFHVDPGVFYFKDFHGEIFGHAKRWFSRRAPGNLGKVGARTFA